jgi:HlyD family secretion protein
MAETSKRRHPPIPVIVVVLLLLIGGGFWWWWSATQTSSATSEQQLSGSVEASQYQVMPAVAGPIVKVLVGEGDKVTKGQEVVRLDRTALKLTLTQAEQGVTAAKAALTNARDDDDSTDADITAAKARLRQAEAAVKLAKVQLGFTIVTSPANGTVVSVLTNAGQNAGQGRALLTIVDPADLYVRVFVPEPAVGRVAVGQSATVTTDSSTQSFTGTVSFIASESEFTPNNVQTKDQRVKRVFEVRIRIADGSGTLKAGMPVDAVLG